MFKIVLDGTFPYGRHAVTLQRQSPVRLGIANDIVREFLVPKFRIALGATRELAAVLVPEASVDKDCYAVFEDEQVGCTGQVPAMELVAKTCAEQFLSHEHFRLRIFRVDCLHHLRAVHGNTFFATAFHRLSRKKILPDVVPVLFKFFNVCGVAQAGLGFGHVFLVVLVRKPELDAKRDDAADDAE